MADNLYLARSLEQLRQDQTRLKEENVHLREQYDSKIRADREKEKEIFRKNEILREQDEKIVRLEEYLVDLDEKMRKEPKKAAGHVPSELQGIPGVDVSSTEHGLKLTMQDQVFFPKGNHKLTRQGKESLRRVAPSLRQGGIYIRIEGHTDSDPVVKTKKRYPYGNMQLSGERALEVLAFLHSLGIPEKHMYYVGYGKNKPVVPNTSKKNKSKNRRVEIFVSNPNTQPAGE